MAPVGCEPDLTQWHLLDVSWPLPRSGSVQGKSANGLQPAPLALLPIEQYPGFRAHRGPDDSPLHSSLPRCPIHTISAHEPLKPSPGPRGRELCTPCSSALRPAFWHACPPAHLHLGTRGLAAGHHPPSHALTMGEEPAVTHTTRLTRGWAEPEGTSRDSSIQPPPLLEAWAESQLPPCSTPPASAVSPPRSMCLNP